MNKIKIAVTAFAGINHTIAAHSKNDGSLKLYHTRGVLSTPATRRIVSYLEAM